ncbi:rCG61429 [Rattus norvegicus]|uniref:RCG61429 n=1 Tax=Rattus norvegicus TaxID=10116 RepID=A6HAG3_RAT|nr:rCG61429 [Rattus norvegicus]
MKAELTDCLHLLYALTFLIISSTAMSQASRTQRYNGTPDGAASCAQPPTPLLAAPEPDCEMYSITVNK